MLRKLTRGEVSKIPYDLLLLGLTYWLAMIPTVALVLQRLGYVFRRQRSWTSLDVLQSSLLVACGTLVLGGYPYMEIAFDQSLREWLPDPLMRRTPFAVISFTLLLLAQWCLPHRQ